MILLWILQFKKAHLNLNDILELQDWRSFSFDIPKKNAQLLIQSTNVYNKKFARQSFLYGELHWTFWSHLKLHDHWRSFNLNTTKNHRSSSAITTTPSGSTPPIVILFVVPPRQQLFLLTFYSSSTTPIIIFSYSTPTLIVFQVTSYSSLVVIVLHFSYWTLVVQLSICGYYKDVATSLLVHIQTKACC
jgi:hypothetical protein